MLDDHKDFSRDWAIDKFGEGKCYAIQSLPFTYAFFMNNPDTIEVLYDVINAGGDTDSNGSMIGAMLGARHGVSIFPKKLIDGLDQDKLAVVMDTAERFIYKYVG